MPNDFLSAKRVLITQADAFMGPMLCEVFAEHGALGMRPRRHLGAPPYYPGPWRGWGTETRIDEGVGQMGDDPLGPSVKLRRHGFVQRRDLRDLHGRGSRRSRGGEAPDQQPSGRGKVPGTWIFP